MRSSVAVSHCVLRSLTSRQDVGRPGEPHRPPPLRGLRARRPDAGLGRLRSDGPALEPARRPQAAKQPGTRGTHPHPGLLPRRPHPSHWRRRPDGPAVGGFDRPAMRDAHRARRQGPRRRLQPGRTLLASGANYLTLRLWDTWTGDLLQTLAEPQQVWCLAFSPDGKTLASGGKTGGSNSGTQPPAWRCSPSRGINTGSMRWPSPPTGGRWPRSAMTGPCSCGRRTARRSEPVTGVAPATARIRPTGCGGTFVICPS
jgi:WD domain, G-beta repeat